MKIQATIVYNWKRVFIFQSLCSVWSAHFGWWSRQLWWLARSARERLTHLAGRSGCASQTRSLPPFWALFPLHTEWPPEQHFWTTWPLSFYLQLLDPGTSTWLSARSSHSPFQRTRPQNAAQPDPIRILSLDFSNCSGRGDSLSSTGWSQKVPRSGGWFMISTSRRNQVSQTVKNKMGYAERRAKTGRALHPLSCATEAQLHSSALLMAWLFQHLLVFLKVYTFPYFLVWI